MAGLSRSIRIRGFLETWFLGIMVALLVLTMFFGWWAFQVNASPQYVHEDRIVNEWTESTTFNHSAVVINDTRVWERGERLTNRPIYFTRISPNLDGTYQYAYAADSGAVTVRTETFLLIRAINNDDDVLWELVEPLDTETSTGLGPHERHSSEFSVNVSYVLETISQVEGDLGSREGLKDVRVLSVSTVEGTVEGEQIDQTHTSEFPMVVTPGTFRVRTSITIDERHRTIEPVAVPVQPTRVQAYGSIVLFALTASLLVSLTYGRSTGLIELSSHERELMTIETQRNRFAEWITVGKIPTTRQYESIIVVNTLEGLVDLAIDTNNRVIEDPELGVSIVQEDDLAFIYIRPDSPARDWMYRMADSTIDEYQEYQS